MELFAYLMVFWTLGFVAGCIAGSGWRKHRCAELFQKWQEFRDKAIADEDFTASEFEQLRALLREHFPTPKERMKARREH